MNIEQIYQNRRDIVQRNLDMKKSEIYMAFPELEKLDRQINLKNLEIAKNKTFGDDKKSDIATLELKELRMRRKDFLLINGIAESDFLPKFYCDICCDRGYVEEGNAIKNCVCFLKTQEKLRKDNTSLLSRIERENFSTFDLSIFDDTKRYESPIGSGIYSTEFENIIKIKQASENFVEKFDAKGESTGLLFYGPVGLGKSFMCSSIAKAIFSKGKTVLYYTIDELLDLVELYTFNREIFLKNFSIEDYYAIFRADLLIIDDFGAEMTNSFANNTLLSIIDSRMVSFRKTVISTNLTPDEIDSRYDERLTSRLMTYMQYYEFFGENKR